MKESYQMILSRNESIDFERGFWEIYVGITT